MKLGFLLLAAVSLFACRPAVVEAEEDDPRSEMDLTAIYCAKVGGQTETRHNFSFASGKSHVRVDCETATEVVEAGLDKRSSLDSVQQALFFAYVTGKTPVVVIFDTDGVEKVYEHRIKTACKAVGVAFRWIAASTL